MRFSPETETVNKFELLASGLATTKMFFLSFFLITDLHKITKGPGFMAFIREYAWSRVIGTTVVSLEEHKNKFEIEYIVATKCRFVCEHHKRDSFGTCRLLPC